MYSLWFGDDTKKHIAEKHGRLGEICHNKCSTYTQFRFRRVLWLVMLLCNLILMVVGSYAVDYGENTGIEDIHIIYFVFLFSNLILEIVTFPFVAYNYGLSPFIVSLFLLLVVVYPAFGVFLLLITEDDSIVIFGWCLVLILSLCGMIYVAFNANNLLLKSIDVTEMNGTFLQIMLEVYGLISYIFIIITYFSGVIDWVWGFLTIGTIFGSRIFVWIDLRAGWDPNSGGMFPFFSIKFLHLL